MMDAEKLLFSIFYQDCIKIPSKVINIEKLYFSILIKIACFYVFIIVIIVKTHVVRYNVLYQLWRVSDKRGTSSFLDSRLANPTRI